MSYKETLMADLKQAMKDKDKLAKDTITLIRASIKQREVDERKELNDDDILDVINKEVKERRSSIEEFERGNRQDLVDKTNAEIDILLKYLPEQLSEDDIASMIKDVMDKEGITSANEMGKLMKNVMPMVKGKADGKLVSKIAGQMLKA
ncbi:GatB/YqeY domain-containing protein [Peptoniphilus equinus]|uniref:GatB/YqeY domain-containing protein n=1 Tax=Peptoniphilus equinus TaxID=3016343 RepID=A0ABY7QVJ5_9FIRM|nr:GatB/YqeY domain-containing protein [Peptoniphilus equinus]WBW50371.1 GatB/YqeY domain-containing protein [Peptoniphilus equinus]